MYRAPRLFVRVLLGCVLAAVAVRTGFACGIDLYVTSDAVDQVRHYAGASGTYQNILLASNAAQGQLGIHFGSTNNRVLVGHFAGGVEEFNATTGAYIKTYNPGGGVQWAGLYAPNGNVLIGDWNTNDVREYNSTTAAFVQVLTTVLIPSDMLIGPNGNLYVCSYGGGFVKEVNATNGAFVSQWSQPATSQTNDIAFNPNGEILVTAMMTNVVYRYDGAHTLLGSFAGTGWGRTHGITFSPWTGNVLVSDGITSQVHEFNPTTYVELNPAFLVPGPGEKIVDVDFFTAIPTVSTPFCFGDLTDAVCPCGNTGLTGRGCNNTLGTGGVSLSADGFASVAADTLRLNCNFAVPFGPGLYYQGSTTANPSAPFGVPFGNGLRCAGGSTPRLEIQIADGSGASNTTVEIHLFGSCAAGDTRNYQLWYRDSPNFGSCTGGFNFSNALQLTWIP